MNITPDDYAIDPEKRAVVDELVARAGVATSDVYLATQEGDGFDDGWMLHCYESPRRVIDGDRMASYRKFVKQP